jgi:RHS repeat-associated protein
MLVPNRHGSSTAYRYGFNGMEKDDELKGIGNSYDFGARMLDPRVGRFLSRDPLSRNFPFESNYVYVSNNPQIYTDPTGEAKILTLNFIDERTGRKHSISIVIDEDDIVAKPTDWNNLLVATEYTWYDINVIQDVRIDKNGKYIFGNTTTKMLDRARTVTERGLILDGDNETYARMKIAIDEATTEKEYPKENESWSGGGIDFYSKNGDGSGVKAKDRSNLDYINGDDMLIIAGMFKSFGKEGGQVPFPTSVAGKFSDAELQALKNVFDQSKKLAEEIGKITTVVDNQIEAAPRIKKEIDENRVKSKDSTDVHYYDNNSGKHIRTEKRKTRANE